MGTEKTNPTLPETSDLQAERRRVQKELQELKVNPSAGNNLARPLAPKVSSLSSPAGETLSGRVSALEKQIRKLEVLTVISGRLGQVNNRDEFIRALQEICANLVGSEEIAIFEKTSSHDMQLVATWDDGSAESLSNVRAGQGIIGRVMLEGKTYFRDRGPAPTLDYEQRLTACVALKVRSRNIGVLALFGLLPQKQNLLHQDQEVLEFLGGHLKNALLESHEGAKHAW